jgi:hypothetical protein
MGAENNKPTEVSNNIMIHQNTPQEIQPKEKSTTASGSSTTQFGRR